MVIGQSIVFQMHNHTNISNAIKKHKIVLLNCINSLTPATHALKGKIKQQIYSSFKISVNIKLFSSWSHCVDSLLLTRLYIVVVSHFILALAMSEEINEYALSLAWKLDIRLPELLEGLKKLSWMIQGSKIRQKVFSTDISSFSGKLLKMIYLKAFIKQNTRKMLNAYRMWW